MHMAWQDMLDDVIAPFSNPESPGLPFNQSTLKSEELKPVQLFEEFDFGYVIHLKIKINLIY